MPTGDTEGEAGGIGGLDIIVAPVEWRRFGSTAASPSADGEKSKRRTTGRARNEGEPGPNKSYTYNRTLQHTHTHTHVAGGACRVSVGNWN